MSIGQRVSFNYEAERVRTTINEDVNCAIGSGASMPRKPSAFRRPRRHEKVTELLLADEPEPMPARRTKSWILLSDTCLLWSNKYEKIYCFIDLDGRGRDANVKRTAGIAQPGHDDATNLEAQGNGEPTSSAAQGSIDSGDNSKQ